MARVLCIADLQCPFDHDDYVYFLGAVKDKYKTDTVVCIGDEIDLHALSDYDHDPDGYSAGDELQMAIDRLQRYYKAFPNTFVVESNHSGRMLKRAYKSGIPIKCMKDFKDVVEAPKGWNWKFKHVIDGVVYVHGVGYSGTMGALNAAKDEMRPCVIGHLHADAGLLFWSNGEKVLWGLNVGSGIDQRAYAFAYSKTSRKKAVLSCGVIIEGRPILIYMNIQANGRWDGKV